MSSTHFGYESVDEREKARRVRGVFDSVAPRYDLMNDLMSMGLHRGWKAYTVLAANVQPGDRVLDIAGGTGDLALAFARKVGPAGRVVHTDINEAMLRTGRDRLLDAGVALPTLVCDAEKLPFASDSFDLVSVAFGLRILPQLGKLVAGDSASYHYLAESIRMHPDQQELKALMQEGGFGHVDYHNLTGGVVALHVGIKC